MYSQSTPTIGISIERFLMTYRGFTYTYEHGTVQGTVYHIGARLAPSANDVQDFAIILFFELPSGEVVRVAKVDDTEHGDGKIHVHRNYREEGVEVRDFDVEISDWTEAEAHLKEHAERMVRTYIDNHGKAPREDI